MNNQTLTVSSIYTPPDYKADQLQKHNCKNKKHNCKNKKNKKQVLRQLLHPYTVCADSNAHHTAWGSDESDTSGKMLIEFIDEEDLMIINNEEPTYLTNTGNFTNIELTISSKDIATTFSWNPHHDFLDSDHCSVIIQTAVGAAKMENEGR